MVTRGMVMRALSSHAQPAVRRHTHRLPTLPSFLAGTAPRPRSSTPTHTQRCRAPPPLLRHMPRSTQQARPTPPTRGAQAARGTAHGSGAPALPFVAHVWPFLRHNGDTLGTNSSNTNTAAHLVHHALQRALKLLLGHAAQQVRLSLLSGHRINHPCILARLLLGLRTRVRAGVRACVLCAGETTPAAVRPLLLPTTGPSRLCAP